MSALLGLSAAAARQVLVSGRISDAVTGRGIDGAALSLGYDGDDDGVFVSLPARLGRRGDGWFAFHLPPELLPRPSAATPALRVIAAAAGHQPDQVVLAVPKADLAIEAETRSLAGHDVTLARIAMAPLRMDLALAPLPVGFVGGVFVEGDPDQPAAAAAVEVIAPPGASTATDAEGGFRLAALPVAAVVKIRITHGGHVQDHDIRPDYSQRINHAVFATA